MLRLGKKPARYDRRTLRLSRYMSPGLPEPPASVCNSRNVASWGVLLNDQISCCTISAVGHAVQSMVLSQVDARVIAPPIPVADETVLHYYETWDGYNPSDPATDQGGVELDVLNHWRKEGFAGRELLAYADPNHMDIDHVKQAIWLFGGLYVGIELPVSAQGRVVWSTATGPDAEPGSWGGHAVWVPDFDEQGLICVTWGALQRMTWPFWKKYVDECHAILLNEWRAPAGFDMATLREDLQAVTA